MNLVTILLEKAKQHPDLPAIIDRKDGTDRTVTFHELADRVSSGSAHLHSLGLRKGQTLLVFQPVSIELYEILLAAFHSGIRVMLADPSAGLKFISLCCQRAMPDAFFGPWKAHGLRLAIPELRKVKTPIRSGAWFPGTHTWKISGESRSLTEVPDSHPALVTFTSGSTGIPKAAVRTHGFLLAQHSALSESMDFQSGETDLITLPVFVLANLASGMTSVLADTNLAKPGSPDRLAILRQCETFRVTRCAASPAFFAAFSDDLPAFEKIFTGGAPVFPDLLRRLQSALPAAEIHSVYGSTEAEPIAHLPAHEYDESLRKTTRLGGGLCTGKTALGIRLEIIPNQSGKPLPNLDPTEFSEFLLDPIHAGEIIVSGPHVLSGYLDGLGDEETKINVGGTIWHRTGDAGWIDTEGRIWLLGRASEILPTFPTTNGLPADALCYPFAIECALREQFPGIRTAALDSEGTRTLVIETGAHDEEIENTPQALGINSVISILKIPLDRRHNAKIDYPALRSILEKSHPR